MYTQRGNLDNIQWLLRLQHRNGQGQKSTFVSPIEGIRQGGPEFWPKMRRLEWQSLSSAGLEANKTLRWFVATRD